MKTSADKVMAADKSLTLVKLAGSRVVLRSAKRQSKELPAKANKAKAVLTTSWFCVKPFALPILGARLLQNWQRT
jgi:hypothetical protein